MKNWPWWWGLSLIMGGLVLSKAARGEITAEMASIAIVILFWLSWLGATTYSSPPDRVQPKGGDGKMTVQEQGSLLCPACGEEIQRLGADFCPYCGASLQCRQEIKLPEYCSSCGSKLERVAKDLLVCPICQRGDIPETEYTSPSGKVFLGREEGSAADPNPFLLPPGPWELFGALVQPPRFQKPWPRKLAEIRFNWGAYLLGPFWTLSHRLWFWGFVQLAILIVALFGDPEAGLPVSLPRLSLFMLGLPGWWISLWLGFKGNRWAWAAREFKSLEQFQAVQRKWFVWGWGLTAVSWTATLVWWPRDFLKAVVSTFLPVYHLFP